MALEEGAINLSQGFPDFQVSPELVELIASKMREGHNQYAPMPGAPILREVIAQVIRESFGRTTDPETEITITSGATESIFSAIAALLQPGQEVILFDPAYDSYDPVVRLSGGVPVHLELRPPSFKIDWEQVEQVINPRTRMIVINSPHNPSGSVLMEADLRRLEQLASEHDLIVISDEVYERIIFDGLEHQSVLRFPELSSRAVAVFSFGKTFHATGWKVGYAVAPEILTREIRKTHQFVTFSVNTPIQLALAEYLRTPDHYRTLGAFFQRKRDFFLNQIKGSSFEPLPCRGSYFQLVSYRAISDRADTEMAEWMTRVHKLASIPVSVFYKNNVQDQLLRFCFAKGDDTLEKASRIMKAL